MTATQFNTVDKVNGTLSNVNKTFTSTSGAAGVRAVDPQMAGKYYVEYTRNTNSQSGDSVGIANAAAPYSSFNSGKDGAWCQFVGNTWVNGTNMTSLSLFWTTCDMAVDLDNALIWFRTDGGNWNGSGTANPATTTGGWDISAFCKAGVFPAIGIVNSGGVYSCNFGGSAFSRTAPSGFIAWPTLAAGMKIDPPSVKQNSAAGTPSSLILSGVNTSQANTVLYVVANLDGGTRTVSGISDSAGLTWALRKRQTYNGGVNCLEIWKATAASQLTGDSITVTFSGAVTNGAQVSCCAFAGATGNVMSDTDASLPGAASGSSTTASVSGYNTSAEAISVGFIGTSGGSFSAAPSAPSTWANIQSMWAGVGTGMSIGFFGKYKSSAVSSGSLSETIPASTPWAEIIDAIIVSTPPSGTWGSTEAQDTFAASGGNLSGTMGPTEAKDTLGASGGNLGGTMGPTEAKDRWVTPPFGTWGSTEAHDTFAGTGYPNLEGVWGSTEATDTYHMAGGAVPDLTFDSFATGTAATPAGGPVPTSVSATISTTYSDDVIVVMIGDGGFWDYHPVASVTDTAGLTWKRRATRNTSGASTGAKSVDIWWAHAPTPLSADVITVNFTGGTGQAVMNVIAVAGANYSAPWDVHPYANQLNYKSVFGQSMESGFTSTNAGKTMNLLMSSSYGFAVQSAANTGYPYTFLGTALANEHNGGGQVNVGSAYALYGAAQDQTSVSFGPNGNSVFYSDSIVQAGQVGTADEVVYWFDGYAWQIGTGKQIWPSNVAIFSGANGTVQCSISTGSPNEIIVAAVSLFNVGGAGTVSSIADSAGLASGWTRRSRKTSADGTMALEVWYALAPTALSGMAITAHTSGTVASDYAQILAFGIAGATYFYDGVLWDGDASLPDEATYTSSTTAIGQVVTGMSTINVNTLDLAFMTNFDTTQPFLPAPGGAATYPDALGPFSNTTSPNNSMGVLFKFSDGQLASDLMSSTVSSKKWVTIGDALPVGLPQPPTGTWGSHEGVDIWTATGFVPAFGTMNPTEHPDAPGGAPNTPPFTGVGWLGWVPAFATMSPVDSPDRAVAEGWVIGAPLTGVMGPTESKDRAGLSNRTTVTGTMGLTELSDRLASAGFELPKVFPAPPRKRRLLIVS